MGEARFAFEAVCMELTGLPVKNSTPTEEIEGLLTQVLLTVMSLPLSEPLMAFVLENSELRRLHFYTEGHSLSATCFHFRSPTKL